MSDIIKSDLQELFDQIRQRIIAARSAAARNINTLQVLTNFEIGRLIVEHEQQGTTRAEYGKETLLALSHRLTKEFGRGFSRSNLEYMRKFFLTYLERLPEKSQTASGKLPVTEKSQIVSGKSGMPHFVQAVLAQTKQPFSLSWSQYVFTLPKDAQIYASEYQLYLPSKEELRQKLLEWTEGVGE